MELHDKLNQYKRFSHLIKKIMDCIDEYIPIDDVHQLDRVVVFDKNLNEKYPYAGGMYYLKKNDEPAFIELYMEELLNGIPRCIPRVGYCIKYSILRMLLHEIGHHVNRKYAYERDRDRWESESSKYAMQYLWDIYGYQMYIFLTLGSIAKQVN